MCTTVWTLVVHLRFNRLPVEAGKKNMGGPGRLTPLPNRHCPTTIRPLCALSAIPIQSSTSASALLVRFCCMAQPQWNIGTRRMEGCALVPPCMEYVVLCIFVFTRCVRNGPRKIFKKYNMGWRKVEHEQLVSGPFSFSDDVLAATHLHHPSSFTLLPLQRRLLSRTSRPSPPRVVAALFSTLLSLTAPAEPWLRPLLDPCS